MLTNKSNLFQSQTKSAEVTIIIVATAKDIFLLKKVIGFASKSLVNFKINEVKVVVPNAEQSMFINQLANSHFDFHVSVQDEDDILKHSDARILFGGKFPGRENWCYQQFLKIGSVLDLKTPYGMVIDCDTLLINSQNWLFENGRTRIMPTLEFEPQYERLLLNLGLKHVDQQRSFVPHHMLYEVAFLKSALDQLGINEIMELAKRVEELSERGLYSPFCIDYSLYGHSIYSEFGKDSLLRWSNIEIPHCLLHYFTPESIPTKILSKFFNSISMHSWKMTG